MKSFGISLLPVIPMRNEPGERSEMVSQLLFGELFIVKEENEKWVFIETDSDKYCGWIDKIMPEFISEDCFLELKSSEKYILTDLCSKVSLINEDNNDSISLLSAGSVFYNTTDGYSEICGKRYNLLGLNLFSSKAEKKINVTETALKFLNIPYLWGGKNALGMDCSGFVQIVFRLHGIDLPRDASQQFLLGSEIKDRKNISQGDLLFFSNEKGQITHVGIALSDGFIIHCSGNVHIDLLTDEGIYNERLKRITHKNLHIKRICK